MAQGLFKGVRGGTPTGDPLCRSCRFGMYFKGARESTETLRCTMLDRDMRFEVYECTSYNFKSSVHINDMREMAWYLRSDKKSGKWGFVPASEATQKEKWDEIKEPESYNGPRPT